MKFTFKILTLISTTSVFAFSINNKIIPRNADLEYQNALNCKNNLDSLIKECSPSRGSFSKENIDKFCETFNSQKCKDFIKDPVKTAKCEDVPDYNLSSYNEFISDANVASQLSCAKNESNEYCPIAELKIYDRVEENSEFLGYISIAVPTDDDWNKALKETCASKKCYDVAYNIFKDPVWGMIYSSNLGLHTFKFENYNFTHDPPEYEESEKAFSKVHNLTLIGKDILETKECTIQVPGYSETNATSKNKINSFLIITFLCLLLSIF